MDVCCLYIGDWEYFVGVFDGLVCGVIVLFHLFGFSSEVVLYGELVGDLLIRPLDGVFVVVEVDG